MLLTVLALGALDSLNPTSITGAIYLAGSGQTARLRQFILAVYCTYLLFGLALLLGPAAALRSALDATPATVRPLLEVAAGGLLVAIGIRTWRGRGAPRLESEPGAFSRRRSGLALGVLATLTDLPTAGPLLAATTLLAARSANVWTQIAELSLYNVVYISPLLVVAVVHGKNSRAAAGRPGLPARGPALAALCVAVGAIIGCEGIAALV